MGVPFSAIIPAAGTSSRMGVDKTLLPARPGVTFADNLVTCFREYGCNPVVMVVNDKIDITRLNKDKVKIVVNHQLELGRSHSIQLAIHFIPRDSACFIQNIDNPFFDSVLLDNLLDSIKPGGYAVPVCNGHGGHPVLLGAQVVGFLQQQKELVDFRRALAQFSRIEVPYPDERILLNINTREEYTEFLSRNRD